MTSAPPLADFLIARIADDEAAARGVLDDTAWLGDETAAKEIIGTGVPGFTPDRVLRECESKRRIVDVYVRTAAAMDRITREDELVYVGARVAAEEAALMARLLGLPYADHADYRDEWRPAAQ